MNYIELLKGADPLALMFFLSIAWLMAMPFAFMLVTKAIVFLAPAQSRAVIEEFSKKLWGWSLFAVFAIWFFLALYTCVSDPLGTIRAKMCEYAPHSDC